MAICSTCQLEMHDVDSCTGTHWMIGGKAYQRIVAGPKGDQWPLRDGRCHDCNVAPGGFHHPGCDAERCPRCGLQAITCTCPYDEEL
jgi:hypothetical protein